MPYYKPGHDVVLRGQTAIFLQGIITFSTITHKNIGSAWCGSYCQVVLDTSKPTGGVKMLIESYSVLKDGLRI